MGQIRLGGHVEDSEPGRQHLSSSEKTAPRRQEEESGIYKFVTKGAGSNVEDYCEVKKKNQIES